MSQLNVGTLRPSEAFTVPLQSTSVRNNTNHAVGSIIYNTDTNAAQVLTANDGWLNLGKGKVIATGGTAEAASKLIEISKGKVGAFIFVINLFDLGGSDKLTKKGFKVVNLIEFPGH